MVSDIATYPASVIDGDSNLQEEKKYFNTKKLTRTKLMRLLSWPNVMLEDQNQSSMRKNMRRKAIIAESISQRI